MERDYTLEYLDEITKRLREIYDTQREAIVKCAKIIADKIA